VGRGAVTDMMERVNYNSRPQTNPECTAVKGHGTQHAYRKFRCRCDEAIAAYRAMPPRKSRAKTRNRTVVAARPGCGADKHDTLAAWRVGCRCELAEVMHERRIQRSADYRARGKVVVNPAAAFRGPATRVSRIAVLLLTEGFPDPAATTRERQIAIEALARRGNRAGTALLTTEEIGWRLGLDESIVRALRSQFRALRTTRTQRRLADVRSKAMRVARALEKETNR
jgi:hypothetical protein